jgi:imidazolonepropionase-like amidohydrolase
MKRSAIALAALLCAAMATAQTPGPKTSEPLAPFVKIDAPVLVLENLRVIDGTGAPAQDNQMVVIENGNIASVGPQTADQLLPTGAKVIDLAGKTVFPGMVGMHEHLFYPLPDGGPGLLPLYGEMADSAPRLYLAGGVTTARTAGSLEPYTDISVKQEIDEGEIPGPKLFLTGPRRRSGRSCTSSPGLTMRRGSSTTGQQKA